MARFSKLLAWIANAGQTSPLDTTLTTTETYVNRFGEKRTLKMVRDMKGSVLVCNQTGFAYSYETKNGVANVFYDVMPHNEDLIAKVA